jgi:hypothetical protein
MTTLFGMWSAQAASWLTRGGRVIAHGDRGEMEFLYPGATVRPLRGLRRDDVLMVRELPENDGLRFPLRREDFW